MAQKGASVERLKPATTEIARVSVLMPQKLRTKIERTAKNERRALSPQIVFLIEAGLAAVKGGATA